MRQYGQLFFSCHARATSQGGRRVGRAAGQTWEMMSEEASASMRAASAASSARAGWERRWEPTTKRASFSSATGSTTSFTTHRMSNLQRRGVTQGECAAGVTEPSRAQMTSAATPKTIARWRVEWGPGHALHSVASAHRERMGSDSSTFSAKVREES